MVTGDIIYNTKAVVKFYGISDHYSLVNQCCQCTPLTHHHVWDINRMFCACYTHELGVEIVYINVCIASLQYKIPCIVMCGVRYLMLILFWERSRKYLLVMMKQPGMHPGLH